jgi:hypothetical protein
VFDFTINSLFGCGHRRITFPQTPARETLTSTGHRHGTYVVCLECGREFQYDWSQMIIGEPLPVRPYATRFKNIRVTPRPNYQENRGLANSMQA